MFEGSEAHSEIRPTSARFHFAEVPVMAAATRGRSGAGSGRSQNRESIPGKLGGVSLRAGRYIA